MTFLQLIEGLRFSAADDGDGFQEIRIRTLTARMPGEFRGEVTGNEARKRIIRYVLSTAAGMVSADQATKESFYAASRQLCANADLEYEGLVAKAAEAQA